MFEYTMFECTMFECTMFEGTMFECEKGHLDGLLVQCPSEIAFFTTTKEDKSDINSNVIGSYKSF